MNRTAAQALVATLEAHGVDRVFCVPGESYLPVLDALRDAAGIRLVTCRHESGAGFMAVADAKLTGRAGTLFVSRGPGAANAAIAVHTADQDAAPMVLFVGQVPRRDLGRRAFQEVDYVTTFADMAKRVVQVEDPGALAATAAEAYRTAESGTPGAVVVAVPEDVFSGPAEVQPFAPLPRPRLLPAEGDVAAVAERLAAAERPLVVAGGAVGGLAGRRALQAAAERWRLPVAVGFKRQDLFANDHPNFAGYLGYGAPKALVDMLAEADLVLAVGTRLGDVTTQGYRLPRPDQPLLQVYPDAAQLGRVFPLEIGVAAEVAPFLEALAGRAPPPAPPGRAEWLARLHALHAELARWRPATAPPDGVDFGHVVAALGVALGPDAVLITDGGNFASWAHRYFPFKPTQTLLGAVTGAMGFGVPAAVAAALRHADRQVVALVGDGGFLMTGNELATALKYGARVRIFVADNRSYGTIRLHQEKAYPGRPVATELVNPDFARLAEAFGAVGLRIDRPEDAPETVRRALAADGPVVVGVRTSLEHISAYTTLADLARPASEPAETGASGAVR